MIGGETTSLKHEVPWNEHWSNAGKEIRPENPEKTTFGVIVSRQMSGNRTVDDDFGQKSTTGAHMVH
jgi:hypothetical protein